MEKYEQEQPVMRAAMDAEGPPSEVRHGSWPKGRCDHVRVTVLKTQRGNWWCIVEAVYRHFDLVLRNYHSYDIAGLKIQMMEGGPKEPLLRAIQEALPEGRFWQEESMRKSAG
jgi:hypothetical protein